MTNTRIQVMTYTEAYDLGLEDAAAHRLPRYTAPRSFRASVGRFGYSDGFQTGIKRRKGPAAFDPPISHNVVLRGGPGEGMLMEMAAVTDTLVWNSTWRELEPGKYLRTEDVEGELTVFRWEPQS